MPVHTSRGRCKVARWQSPCPSLPDAPSADAASLFGAGPPVPYSTAAPNIATGTTYLMTFITGVACAAAPITEAVAIGDTLE